MRLTTPLNAYHVNVAINRLRQYYLNTFGLSLHFEYVGPINYPASENQKSMNTQELGWYQSIFIGHVCSTTNPFSMPMMNQLVENDLNIIEIDVKGEQKEVMFPLENLLDSYREGIYLIGHQFRITSSNVGSCFKELNNLDNEK